MIKKFRGMRDSLSIKIKNAIHEVFMSVPQLDNTKPQQIFIWKKLPAVKESYNKLFQPMSKEKNLTYMDYIIGKVWDDPKNDSQIQIAWAISIAKFYLNPNNNCVRIGEDSIKESLEKNLVSILFSNEILRNITKFSNKIFKIILNNSGTFENTSEESDENNESPSTTPRTPPLPRTPPPRISPPPRTSPPPLPRTSVNKRKKIRNFEITEEIMEEITFPPLDVIRKRAEKRAEQNLKKRPLEEVEEEEEDDDDDYNYKESDDDEVSEHHSDEENNSEHSEIN